jgi:hypothetical protein
MGRKAWAKTLVVSKLSTTGDGGALNCAHKGQSMLLDSLTLSPEPSFAAWSALTIFMPPMAEQTI